MSNSDVNPSLPRAFRIVTAVASLAALAMLTGSAFARSPAKPHKRPHPQNVDMGEPMFHGQLAMREQFEPSLPLALLSTPIGAPTPPPTTAPTGLVGSAIVALADGLLVADADSGMLLRVDSGNTTAAAALEIGPDVSQIVVAPDGTRAYVADRRHDEIVVVDLSSGLRRVDAYRTRAEPFGLSLTPDGATLLVTTVADRSLSALDLHTGHEKWTIEVGPEPRGVAVSPDGNEALVTFLTTGAVARVALAPAGSRRASYVALDPGTTTNTNSVTPLADRALSDEGKSFARNAFAVGYVGHGLAVIPHQLSTPHLASDGQRIESGGYGGGSGFVAPVTHRLAFLDTPERGATTGTRLAMAQTALHQPRAMAYDAKVDTLYVAGFGSDNVLAVADVSQSSVRATWTATVSGTDGACGPTGLAVVPGTGDVAVWCSLTRTVVQLEGGHTDANPPAMTQGTLALADSRLSEAQRRGRDMFRSGNDARISTQGAMACSSCHAEVRTDGLSWRLQGKNLQTPLLGGRIEGAHPFKWDGMDPTITDSLTNTVGRLGGNGITSAQAADLAAYLKTVEAPRKPTVQDASAVARGKALFASDKTGCATCHSGPLMTDQQSYDLSTDLGMVDTPSLVGLASSAPYYHDGSAATLQALLLGNANVHGMGRISKLSDAEVGDLVQFLKTL